MNILVTGGLGYIGSHTVVELSEIASTIHIIDNLFNASVEVFSKLEQLLPSKNLVFHKGDLRDESFLSSVFSNPIDAVIHFAALKAVGQSMLKPLDYYQVNVGGTINLLQAMKSANVNKFIFSSSACVYGDQGGIYVETCPTDAVNVYGKTKVMVETILKDYAYANKEFSAIILRYFNPVGAHPSGLIGEDPNGIPDNLVPFIQKVATGRLEKLRVFGNDYISNDGTGIRDYIHIVDLAKGHVTALHHLKPGCEVYNLGTGKGTTVLELIKTYEKVIGREIPYEIVGRRDGDVNTLQSIPTKANTDLGWFAEKTVEDMCRDSWNYISSKNI
jgi:UDP-glucose 4-epimerase